MKLENPVGRIAATLLFACVFVVAPALANQPGDAWITTKVKMKLLTADAINGLDINVDTFDGKVTLHGQVTSDAERAESERHAGTVEGVTSVRNLLAVVPSSKRNATQLSDEELAKQVSTVLERDKALDDSKIEIKSVNAGIVVLSGTARTLSAHRRALEDARSVDGVKQVASEIESPNELGDEEIWEASPDARQSASVGLSDAWITTKTKVALMTSTGLSPLAINVDTREGIVTLFGIVSTDEIKNRAAQEVSRLDGVVSIENALQVVPAVSAERVEADDKIMLDAVRARLGARSSLNDAVIEVQVKNHVARLTGTVTSQLDRVTALTIARGTKGVDSVIDDLVYEPKGGLASSQD